MSGPPPKAPASPAGSESKMRLHFPSELPIAARVTDIQQAIAEHQVVIVAGAAGAGQTTQLPEIAVALGLGRGRLIGVTPPGRLAATSVAARGARGVSCTA